jgi:dTDP-4-amino-4,6-dideoxygalactose transaminase
MTELAGFVARRREINRYYRDQLESLPGISFLKNPSPAFNSNHWLTCVIIEPAEAGYTREDVRLAMEAANIETRPLWKPMHLQPVFSRRDAYGKNAPFYGTSVAETLFEKGLCIPSGASLEQNELERVVEVFQKMKHQW